MAIVGKGGYLPQRVKWTAVMAAVVALALAVSSLLLVFRAQCEALTQQAVDSGMSLAKFIAVEAAIPVLGEDWATMGALIDAAAARDTFRYLVVADHEGIVRSASDESLIGSTWEPGGVQGEVFSHSDGSRAQELEQVFNFRLPVLFNQTVVGHVDLGVDRAPLEAALNATRRALVLLAFAMVLAVSLPIYVLNRLIAHNARFAASALKQPDLAAPTESSRQDSRGGDEELEVMLAMRDALSEEWMDTGSSLLESDPEAAINALEKALRYNPGNREASLRLQQARTAQRNLGGSQRL